jgi:VWFA-related protein
MQPHQDGISRRALLLCSAALWPAARLLKAGQETKDATFATDVKVVNVFATVRDKQANIVRDLSKEDFTLEEDGRPQTIRYFSRESDLPLSLGLLVDTSLSQRNVLGQERTASYHFLERVLREDKDQAFVIHFDREVELLQDLTSSRRKLETALEQLELNDQGRGYGGGGGRGYPGSPRRHGVGGGTSLYDAVLLASDELMKPQSGRKALIALTDGVDNGSKVSLTTAIESAQRADTLVYSILFADNGFYAGGYGGPRMGGMGRRGGYPGGARYPRQNRPDGKKILERLSQQTGGGFFEVSEKRPIDKIYDQIQDELRNQYSLGYTSDQQRAGPGYRRINLATTRAGLVVRTRDGYYADR